MDGRSRKLRLGIIGCGAITDNAHLPAALSSSLVEVTALSDTNESRLRYIRRQFGLTCVTATDYRDTFAHVDAVVLALPNCLHAPIGCDFLARGIHVLCEKPLASSLKECEQLCRVARAGGSVLGVGYCTRFFASTELSKQLIDSGLLGTLISFDYEFGTEGGWASISGYNLVRSESGGGVLVVSGSHFIDRMIYLFDDVDVISYSDDSRGGLEANCVATFRASVSGQVLNGELRLSRTQKLSNRLHITGEKGVLEIPEGEPRSVTYFPAGGGMRHEITCPDIEEREQNHFVAQLDNFARAIQTGVACKIDGEQGAKSVALMERCYEIATPMNEPWCDATIERLKTGRQHQVTSNIAACDE